MTLAFEKFMKQYKMTGSEKADGYSQDVFVGLDDEEKKVVFELLVTEIPWAIEWLFFLDTEKALIIAKETESRLRGNPYGDAYIFQQKIVKYSGDLLYQKHMIDDYPSYPERVRPLVVDAIHRTPQNENTVAFFKQLLSSFCGGAMQSRSHKRPNPLRHLLGCP
ncbi:hypothetical protein [Massilia phosphatilytica]